MSIESTTPLTVERINKLAQANLCRLRGEYDRAEGLCVEILQANPDRVEAMAILGDICAERNDLSKARHWYSMAADIEPPLPGVIDKCRQIERRIQSEEQSHTAVISIRAAYSRQKMATWIAVGGAFMALTAALIIGVRKPVQATTSRPIIFSDPPVLQTGTTATTPSPATSTSPVPPLSPEMEILAKIDRPEIKNISAAILDPRTNALTIIATHPGPLPDANEATSLGIDGLQAFASASMVTVRLTDQGNLTYIADITRSDYTRVLTSASSSDGSSSPGGSNPDPTAILSNIWQAPSPNQATNLNPTSGS